MRWHNLCLNFYLAINRIRKDHKHIPLNKNTKQPIMNLGASPQLE